MKKIVLFLIIILSFAVAQAQHSPFKPLPKPLASGKYGATAATTSQTAWRFTAPMGGVLYTKGNAQIVTALGFGYNWLEWNADNSVWDTKFSVNAIILGGGTVAPNPKDLASVLSVGFSLGLLKQHIQIGPVYNFPHGAQTSSFGNNLGAFIAVSMPLN